MLRRLKAAATTSFSNYDTALAAGIQNSFSWIALNQVQGKLNQV
jgi:hypothetical protein